MVSMIEYYSTTYPSIELGMIVLFGALMYKGCSNMLNWVLE